MILPRNYHRFIIIAVISVLEHTFISFSHNSPVTYDRLSAICRSFLFKWREFTPFVAGSYFSLEKDVINPGTNLFAGAAQIRRQKTHSDVLVRLRRDRAILPVGLTRAFFLRCFAQSVLTWVLSLCIIRSAPRISIGYSYSGRSCAAIS